MATLYKIRPVQLVGRKIRQLRKEHNLTQTELSSRIGIQQSDLSRMEKGEYRVSLDTLFRILSEFQMSVGEFFDQMAKESLTERDLRMVNRFQSLDEDTRQEIESVIAKKRPPGMLHGAVQKSQQRAASPKPPKLSEPPRRGRASRSFKEG